MKVHEERPAEEVARIRDAALRLALNTPATPHKTAGRAPKAKERPPSEDGVHKGRTQRK
jgi:hypothetical protein